MAVTRELRCRVHERALGRCECVSEFCTHHEGRCNAELRDRWYVHHRTVDGPDVLSNVMAMCKTCYKNARRLRNASLHELQLR